VDLDVWRVRVSAVPEAGWRPFLDSGELAQADRFHFAADRDRFAVTRSVLKRLLQQRRAGAVEFIFNRWGKPALADGEPHFNVSHSGDYALIAIAPGVEVGIDVEYLARPLRIEELARSVFAPGEFEIFSRLDGPRRDRFFFRVWTCKEAVMKAAGAGLSIPPERIEIGFAGDGTPTVRADAEVLPEGPWSLHEIDVAEGYAAAAAVRTASIHLRVFDWMPPAPAPPVGV
jgi:4'-phosphopantetheinyl transferase